MFSGEIAKSVLGNLGVYFLQEVRETGCSRLSMSHEFDIHWLFCVQNLEGGKVVLFSWPPLGLILGHEMRSSCLEILGGVILRPLFTSEERGRCCAAPNPIGPREV